MAVKIRTNFTFRIDTWTLHLPPTAPPANAGRVRRSTRNHYGTSWRIV
jgi:hypothetical protein